MAKSAWSEGRIAHETFIYLTFVFGKITNDNNACRVDMPICSHFSFHFFVWIPLRVRQWRINKTTKHSRAQPNANKLLTDMRSEISSTCTLTKKVYLFGCSYLNSQHGFGLVFFGFDIFLQLDFPCANTHEHTDTL